MAYLGIIPSENSSGPKHRLGGITKAGNVYLRKLLVESSWHYRYIAPAGKVLNKKRMGQSELVIAYADRAMNRLQKRFSRMHFAGKNSNKIVIAIAREFAGFIWGMMVDKIA